MLTPAEVFTLVETIDQRYRALILLGTFSSLRWGELAALRRSDIDLAARTVRVERQLTEVIGQGLIFGPPKSKAGRRLVPIPEAIIPAVRWHLGCFAADGDDGLVFTSPTGEPLRHSNFRRRVWVKALAAAELADIHFHDLRHTGNNMAATAGATLRELMDRMGHSTTKAALTYLHGSDARQHQIADSLSKIARDEMRRTADRADSPTAPKPSGTQRARRARNAS